MDRKFAIFALGVAAVMWIGLGCRSGAAGQAVPSGRMTLTSSAFANGLIDGLAAIVAHKLKTV